MVLAHLAIIIFAYSSPFILDWRIVFFGVGLFYLQLLLFGNCILTLAQFKEKGDDGSFNMYMLEKLGFKPDQKIVHNTVQYIIPPAIFIVALLWQGVLHI